MPEVTFTPSSKFFAKMTEGWLIMQMMTHQPINIEHDGKEDTFGWLPLVGKYLYMCHSKILNSFAIPKIKK